jgi:hypothetical protein
MTIRRTTTDRGPAVKEETKSSILERLLRARRLISAASRLVDEGINALHHPGGAPEVQIRSLEIKEMPNGSWKVRINDHPLTLTPLLGVLLAALGSGEGTGADPSIVPYKTPEELITVVSRQRRKQWTERGLAQALTRLREELACHIDGAHLVERRAAEAGYRLVVPATIGEHLKAVLATRLIEILNREAKASGAHGLR